MNKTLPPAAILKTLAYAGVFQYPLTAEEIYTYLISPQPLSRGDIAGALKFLVEKEIVGREGEFFFLKNRRELSAVRRRREAASKTKWRKAIYWARFFRLCPWIKLAGISGALAMGNSEADDDLDLVFITAGKRVWLTRAAVALLLILTGQYRRPGKISGRFCPNLFLSEDVLNIFERNLFIAHEIVQLRPLWDRQNLYYRFRFANSWVKDYLPHAPFPPEKSSGAGPENKSRRFFLNYAFDFLEELVKKLQLKFMAGKISREIVADQILRFHPRDTKAMVLESYEGKAKESLEQYSRVMEKEKDTPTAIGS